MAYGIWLLATLIGLTWRIRIDDPSCSAPDKQHPTRRIYCFWHAHLLTIAFAFRNTGVTAIVSKSRDGRIAARIARLWKHTIIAGSSSRGGSDVLRQSIRTLSKNRYLGITPDGPRGPRFSVKPGVAQLSTTTNAPVVILSISVDRFWKLHSWDGFIIPKPFAHITITVTQPLLPSGIKEKTVEMYRETIERKMRNVNKMA